jgi:DNA-binding transcriptional ArsR family regulator
MGTLTSPAPLTSDEELLSGITPDPDGSAEDSCGGLCEDVPVSAITLPGVLAALSDPIRLQMVALLSDGAELTCGQFELPVAKSTKSHHFSVLAQAGVILRRTDGKTRKLRLRREDLDGRFPGLIDAVLTGIDE